MKVAGSAVIAAPQERVWTALQDPAVLVRTIPGCERLETIGPDVYRMTVQAGVASIKGVYEGQVALADPEPQERFVLRARGQGAPGTVDATVRVTLSPADGGTKVEYSADAVVGGMLGGVGQRMLTAVAKKTAGEFFSAVERDLTGAAAPGAAVSGAGAPGHGVGEPAAVSGAATAVPGSGAGVPGSGAGVPGSGAAASEAAAAVPGQVFTRPEPPERASGRRGPSTGRGMMLAAFGMGAGVALGGAVIGWFLGRATRTR